MGGSEARGGGIGHRNKLVNGVNANAWEGRFTLGGFGLENTTPKEVFLRGMSSVTPAPADRA